MQAGPNYFFSAKSSTRYVLIQKVPTPPDNEMVAPLVPMSICNCLSQERYVRVSNVLPLSNHAQISYTAGIPNKTWGRLHLTPSPNP